MITHYLSMPLKDLERIAYMEQNALALACLQVAWDQDEVDDLKKGTANLEKRIEELEDDLYDLHTDYAALQRERDTLLDKLSTLEAQFEQACVELRELRELNLEKQS